MLPPCAAFVVVDVFLFDFPVLLKPVACLLFAYSFAFATAALHVIAVPLYAVAVDVATNVPEAQG